MMADAVLYSGESDVGAMSDGSDIDPSGSPRPYLHSVRTANGVEVTQTGADDHPHHRGWSLAVPDLDGVNYWGGRTYVRGTGSTMLDNHGVQHITAQRRERLASGTSLEQSLDWVAPGGRMQLNEARRVTSREFTADHCLEHGDFVLTWTSTLTSPERVTIGSPATNGREGAFYGGLFWRTPFESAEAIVQEGAGTATAHGSSSPWCAITTEDVSLVFVQRGEPRPWFVRTEDYVGVCQSLATQERLVLEPGQPFELSVSVFVTDRGALTPDEAARIARQLSPASGIPTSDTETIQ